MNYWLIKTEPEEYTWEQLLTDKETAWTGIRNYQARNHLKEMKKGDRVFVYHTGDEKEIRGIAEVVKEFYPDPTSDTDAWVSVDIKALAPVGRSIGLEEIRNTHNLAVMPLVSQPRLSVMPISESQWIDLLKYTKTTL
jgi:predicted RNA-binding protein with PUA-like domain